MISGHPGAKEGGRAARSRVSAMVVWHREARARGVDFSAWFSKLQSRGSEYEEAQRAWNADRGLPQRCQVSAPMMEALRRWSDELPSSPRLSAAAALLDLGGPDAGSKLLDALWHDACQTGPPVQALATRRRAGPKDSAEGEPSETSMTSKAVKHLLGGKEGAGLHAEVPDLDSATLEQGLEGNEKGKDISLGAVHCPRVISHLREKGFSPIGSGDDSELQQALLLLAENLLDMVATSFTTWHESNFARAYDLTRF